MHPWLLLLPTQNPHKMNLNPTPTSSFSTNPAKAVRSTSTGWPIRSYSAITKWKKLLLRKLDGGCFSKWTRPSPTLL